MTRCSITLFACACLLMNLCSCTSTRTVSMADYQKNPNQGISRVVTTEGQVYQFDSDDGRGAAIQNDEIVGILKYGGQKHIAVNQVQSIYYTSPHAGKTLLLGIGIMTGVAVVFGGLFLIYVGE